MATPDSRYAVVFVPYGAGPDGPLVGIVIKVTSSKPVGSVAKPFDFKDRNVIVDVRDFPPAQALTAGGTYDGEIALTEENGLLVPHLLTSPKMQ